MGQFCCFEDIIFFSNVTNLKDEKQSLWKTLMEKIMCFLMGQES